MVSTDDQHGPMRMFGEPREPPQELAPVHPWHREVEDDQVRLATQLLQSVESIYRGLDPVALIGEERGVEIAA